MKVIKRSNNTNRRLAVTPALLLLQGVTIAATASAAAATSNNESAKNSKSIAIAASSSSPRPPALRGLGGTKCDKRCRQKQEEEAAANLFASDTTTTTSTTTTAASTTIVSTTDTATTTSTTTTETAPSSTTATTSETSTATTTAAITTTTLAVETSPATTTVTTTTTATTTSQAEEVATTTTTSTSPLLRVREVTKENWDGKTKSKYFPLGLCEGECDRDRDCQGDLICYQRGAGDTVPGCSGAPNSNSDFCVDPQVLEAIRQGIFDFDSHTDYSAQYVGTSQPTRLRLFRHEIYYWQETREETFWCMQCEGLCEDGRRIKINYCDEANDRQLFIAVGETIRPAGVTSLCFTETGFDVEEEAVTLKPCNGATNQNFYGFKEQGLFQLRPRTGLTHCLTQMHHPKAHELVFPRTCTRVEENDTSLWTCY
jgi:hypothetical protein